MKTVKTNKEQRAAFEIREVFMPVETRPLDSKHRITLGGRLQKLLMRKMKIDSYQISVGKEGDILLRPAVSVPASEVWAYKNPEVIGRIRRGLKDAEEGKVKKVSDLESFLKDL